MRQLRLVCPGDAPARHGSQGQSLAQGVVSNAVLEHVRGCDIDWQIEEFCGFAPKARKIEKRPPGLQVDEKIDIASVLGFPAGNRPKDPQLGYPVFLRDLQKGVPLAPELFGLNAEPSPDGGCRSSLDEGRDRYLQLLPTCGEKALQRGESGERRTRLVTGKGRLRSPCMAGELYLGEPSVNSSISEKGSQIRHIN